MVYILLAILVLAVLAAIFLIWYIIMFQRTLFFGAPFATTKEKHLETMLKLADLDKAKSIVDLGSGDGRLVIQTAKQGKKAKGYEINPYLAWKSNKQIKKLGLQNLASVSKQSFWHINLKDFDVIFIFGIGRIMPALEKKILEEVNPGTKIISNYFQLPNLKPKVVENNIYLYVR